jgi:hypothetical protein
MRSLILAFTVLAACGEETTSPSAPEPRRPLVLRAVPIREGGKIVIDATTADEAWKRAVELLIPLEGEGPKEIRLKAAYDSERIYLLAFWPDETRSLDRYWKYVARARWERHLGEDAFSLCWAPEGLPAAFGKEGCALLCHDGRHIRIDGGGHADLWFWGSQTTSFYGQLRDLWLPFGEHQRLRGDRQPADSDNMLNLSDEYEGPAMVRKMVRPGTGRFLTAENMQPLTVKRLTEKMTLDSNLGWEVPLDILRPMKGSRGDVGAKGRHLGKGWLLEMARDLDTGQTDDRPIDAPEESLHFAVAVHDGTEKEAHSVSRPIELCFVAKR